jgi:hypothetical protein
MKKNKFLFPVLIISAYVMMLFGGGCAQVGAPTGGPRDSLAPILTKAIPEPNKLNFTGNKITLYFDEYIEVKDIQTNLQVSPLTKNNPTITGNLKSVTIKFKDTLQPNTTYNIEFGDAITDVHEGNVLKNFSYTFSTGSLIDSLQFRGKVIMAQTGKVDSTLKVYLYRNAVDSTVTSKKPDYITKLDGKGNFIFNHLPAENFKIYALKDGDGGKTYNNKTEAFAFYDEDINTANPVAVVNLFAYEQEKAAAGNPASSSSQKKPAEKKLKYSSSAGTKFQDLLQPLSFTFSNGLKLYDSSKIIVSDTSFNIIPNLRPTIDSTRKMVSININWQPETEYYFILPKEAFQDSAGNGLEKSDTLRFSTKKVSDYGTVMLRFRNIDLSKNPVIQFLQGEEIKFSSPVKGAEWSNKRFSPGEYEIRILYDRNNNGIWDPGNYKTKVQPERAVSLPQKLSIKADWDNEREIQL